MANKKNNTEAEIEEKVAKVEPSTEEVSPEEIGEDVSENTESASENTSDGGEDAPGSENTEVDKGNEEAPTAEGRIPEQVKKGAARAFELNRNLRTVYVISNGCAFANWHFAKNAAQKLEDKQIRTFYH